MGILCLEGSVINIFAAFGLYVLLVKLRLDGEDIPGRWGRGLVDENTFLG